LGKELPRRRQKQRGEGLTGQTVQLDVASLGKHKAAHDVYEDGLGVSLEPAHSCFNRRTSEYLVIEASQMNFWLIL
jgi:hypothetical protein